MKISVIGLGRLGLPMACVYAARGYDVVGVDVNEGNIRSINNGLCPIPETGLDELLAKVNIQATTDYNDIYGSQIIFIIVPTPSDKSDAFSNDYVIEAIDSICKVYDEHSDAPLIVITSTVMPGTCAEIILPILRNVFGDRTKLCYNPEFVALGSVIENMEYPDSILIGDLDGKSGIELELFYKGFFKENLPPICRMSLWNAEVAKIALNVALTMKIVYANTIADLCEEIPKGDVDVVTNFVGLDSRIGKKYLKGGMSSGGTCLPRDVRAFVAFAEENGIDLPVQRELDKVNMTRTLHIGNRINDIVKGIEEPVIAILGLTFKPDTPVVIDSPSIWLAQYLSDIYKVKVYDPQGLYGSVSMLSNKVIYSESVVDCLAHTDLCVVATAWNEFKGLKPTYFKNLMRTANVYDCWRVYDRKYMIEAGVNYYAVGINS